MKKKLLFLAILSGLTIVPKEAQAASLGLNCPNAVTVGENITCTLTANHDTISGIKGSITFSGMSFQNVTNLTGSNYFSVSSSGFDGAIDIASGAKDLAQFTFSTSTPGTATINAGCTELIDGTNFDTHGCSGASRTITINAKETPPPSNPQPSNPQPTDPTPSQQPQNNLSTNNKLKNINIEGHELKKIDDNNYSLTVTNDIESVKINATAEDSKAKVSGIGSKNLQIGENNIEVIITSESGAQNKIIIKIIRKDGYYKEDLNNVLKNDKLENKDIIINKDSEITKEELEQIKESKKEIKLNYFDENKKLIYSWELSGKEIKKIKNFNTSINITTDKVNNIYEKSNYADGLYVNFKHTGDLPTGTKLKLYVGDKYENNTVLNIYYYNQKDKNLAYVEDNLKVTNGYIDFRIESCSDYLITMATIENATKKEDKSSVLFIVLTIVELFIIIALIVFIIKKINKKTSLFVKKEDTILDKNKECNVSNESKIEVLDEDL